MWLNQNIKNLWTIPVYIMNIEIHWTFLTVGFCVVNQIIENSVSVAIRKNWTMVLRIQLIHQRFQQNIEHVDNVIDVRSTLSSRDRA